MPSPAGPDHRDLYLIVAGVLLGILLGPSVFGWFAPELYRTAFTNPQHANAELEDWVRNYQENERRIRSELAKTGVSGVAIEEATEDAMKKLYDPGRDELEAKVKSARDGAAQNQGRMLALVLAIALVMILETLMAPGAGVTRSRLATARYALIALWIAWVMAQPGLLRQLPVAFFALLTIVALVVALVPLRRRGGVAST